MPILWNDRPAHAPAPRTRLQEALTRLAAIGRQIEDIAFGDEFEPADAGRVQALVESLEGAIARRGF
jgi:hypothetical protein